MKERDASFSLPLSLSRKSFPFIKNCGTPLIRGRKSITMVQINLLFHDPNPPTELVTSPVVFPSADLKMNFVIFYIIIINFIIIWKMIKLFLGFYFQSCLNLSYLSQVIQFNSVLFQKFLSFTTFLWTMKMHPS